MHLSMFFQKTLEKFLLHSISIYYFLMAVSFYLGTYDSAQIKITIVHVMGLFLVMSWLVLKIQEGHFNFFKNNLVYVFPVVLFLFSGLFSLIISPFKLASLNEFIKRFVYCSFVFIIVDIFNSDKKLLKLKNWLIFTSYIVCLYGFLQILDYIFFPKPEALRGLDPFGWRQAFGYRIISTFGNPNFFGDFLVVLGPITLSLLFYKRKIYLAILFCLIVLCAFYTVSKGTWMGFAAGHIILLITYIFIFFREKLSKTIVISAIVSGFIIAAIAGYGIYVKSKERSDSVSFRVFTWLSAWEMINTHPTIGTGLGTFYLTYPAWRRPQIFFIEGKHNTESDHPENEYLEVWYDEGILGFTIFLLLLVTVFVLGYRNILFLRSSQKTRDGPLAYLQLGVICAFAAQLVHDCFCVSLRFVSSGVMFWLLTAITLTISVNFVRNKSEIKPSSFIFPWYFKIILQLIVIAGLSYGIVFFGRHFKADYLHSRAIEFSRAGNWDVALETYTEANKYNPSYVMSYYFKANVHVDRWKAGDPQLAGKTFNKLWTLAPNYVQSKYLAAVMYSKLWNIDIALRQSYIAAGKSSQAISDVETEAIDAYNNGVKYFNQYLEIDPIYALTYYGLASMYANAGNFIDAEKTLLRHIEYPQKLQRPPHSAWKEDWTQRRKSDYAETYSHLGNLYMMQNKFDKAENVYQASLQFVPDSLVVKKNLATAKENLGDKEAAKQIWTNIHSENKDDVDAKAYLEKNGILQTEKK